MTILELKDKKAIVLEENDAVFTLVEGENRSMSDKETKSIETNLQMVRDIDLKIESEERKVSGSGVRVKTEGRSFQNGGERFSLLKAINDKLEGRAQSESTANVTTLGRQEFRSAGVNTSGEIQLPFEVRADITAQTATEGQEIVAEDKKAILPPLVDSLVFAKAGATFLTGLEGTVSIPTYAGTSVAWKSEVAAADDGGGAFAEVTLTPKRITAFIDVSKLFLAQDGIGAEQLLLDNISNAVARKIEETVLGVADGSATQPAGMGYCIASTGAGAKAIITPTYADLVAMESEVDTFNALQGNLAYITNGAGRGILKGIAKVSGTDSKMLCEEDQVNGYPLLVTNACASTAGTDATGDMVVFGNWKDLIVAQWGGYDITIDPYSQAINNQVKIVVNAFVDVVGARGVNGSGVDEEAYYKSFDQIAIHA